MISFRYHSTKSMGAQSAPFCGPCWSQVRGPGGIPGHPEEGELIPSDSGERLLYWPVTTTLALKAEAVTLKTSVSTEEQDTGERRGTRGGFTWVAALSMPPRGLTWSRRIYDTTWESRRLQWAWRIIIVLLIFLSYVIHLLVIKTLYVLLLLYWFKLYMYPVCNHICFDRLPLSRPQTHTPKNRIPLLQYIEAPVEPTTDVTKENSKLKLFLNDGIVTYYFCTGHQSAFYNANNVWWPERENPKLMPIALH